MAPRNDNVSAALLSCVGLVALAAVGIVGSVFVDGFVISTLWRWFVLPLFSLPALTVAQAVGLALCVRAIRPVIIEHDDKGDTRKAWLRLFKYGVLGPAFLLLTGYAVHLYV